MTAQALPIDQSAIRASLAERARELGARIAHLDQLLHQPLPADWEEQAADLETQAATESEEEAAIAEWHRVNAALDRIDAGRFGTCAQCGDAIGAQRLMALPTATRCIDCASR